MLPGMSKAAHNQFPLARIPGAVGFRATCSRVADDDGALKAELADRWGCSFPGRILNISATDVVASADIGLCRRDPVRIHVPIIGWMRGDVAWAQGDHIGIRLRGRIRAEALQAFVKVFGNRPRG